MQLTERAKSYAFPVLPPEMQAEMNELRPTVAKDFPLGPDLLMAVARIQMKLNDFGDAPLAEPLDVLCRSLREDVKLSPLGWRGACLSLLDLLKMRLQFADLWRRHPEIFELPVERPIFIVGMPRSGTTFLHRLMASDPGKRAAPAWELAMPLPLGEIDTEQPEPDPRIGHMAASVELAYKIAPDLRFMHEMAVDEPDEEDVLMTLTFSSLGLEANYAAPQWSRYYRATDQTEGYRYFRKVLQTLQWLRGGSRWILKAPQHLEQLKALKTAFPDAILVQTHRDPVTAVISAASLIAYKRRAFFETVDPHAAGQDAFNIVERLLQAGMRDRPAYEQSFIDIGFDALMVDPIAQVRAIYSLAGDELSPEGETRMRQWLADHRRDRHGTHRYDAADFGFVTDDLYRRLAFYIERFGIPCRG